MPEPIKRLMVAVAMLRMPSTALVQMIDAYQGTYRLGAATATREEVRDHMRAAARIAEAGITPEEVDAWIESRAKGGA